MSGPKIDQAELERRRRDALERERQERLRQIKLATDRFNKVRKELLALCTAIQNENIITLQTIKDQEEMALTLKRIGKTKEDAAAQIMQLANTPLPAEAKEILAQTEMVQRQVLAIQAQYNRQIKPEYDRVEQYAASSAALKKHQKLSEAFSSDKHVLETADFEFAKAEVEKAPALSKEVKADAQAVLHEITALVNAEEITQADRRELVAFTHNIIAAVPQGDAAVQTAIKEYHFAKVGITTRLAAFEELYQEYLAEYVVYIDALNKTRSQQIAITPKTRSAFHDLARLEREVGVLRRLSQTQNEQNYIRAQLNEVMALFGYDLCRDIVLDAEQKGRHYLCPEKNGKNAIHVHVSDSRQIMMEIVGTGSRKAEAGAEISAVSVGADQLEDFESDALLAEQGRFCNLHPQITAELERRGIILNEKVHRHPDRKYCRKIINLVSDTQQTELLTDEEDVINMPYTKRRTATIKEKEKELHIK